MQLIELLQCSAVFATQVRPLLEHRPHFAHAMEAEHPSAVALPKASTTHWVAACAFGGSSHASAGAAGGAIQAGSAVAGAGAGAGSTGVAAAGCLGVGLGAAGAARAAS
jgi:hypothetical protein